MQNQINEYNLSAVTFTNAEGRGSRLESIKHFPTILEALAGVEKDGTFPPVSGLPQGADIITWLYYRNTDLKADEQFESKSISPERFIDEGRKRIIFESIEYTFA